MRRICLALSCLWIGGCQQKEIKNPPRCIYDQTVFADASLGAASNDEQFARFKQNPFFNLLWENESREDGEKWLKIIEEKYPSIKEKFERFREGDRIGSPRVFAFGEAGIFSPSTLKLAAFCAELQSRIGSWKGLNVVQIGSGYGGLCKVMHDVHEFASYTIVDLPEQLALAQRYLLALGLKHVAFLTPEQLSKNASFDLVVSDMSFSEFNRSYQELFFDRIFSRSHSGFLLGRIFPKHYGVVPMNLEELESRFEKQKLSQWEIQEPTLNEGHYFICFKKRSYK